MTGISRNLALTAMGLALGASIMAAAAADEAPIAVGLDADFSGYLKDSSEALRIGMEAAIDEINAAGGVGGRPLELVVTDHRGNPSRGVDHLDHHLVERGVVALLNGAHSPVALAQLPRLAEAGVPLISPWAAATGIVDNGYEPNPAFRVSVRDADAAGFLFGAAIDGGAKRIGLLLENTPWGQSNSDGLNAAAAADQRAAVVSTGWFGHGGEDAVLAVRRVLTSQPDAVIFVGQPVPGLALLSEVARLPVGKRPRVLMHWGVAASAEFGKAAAAIEGVDLGVLQTFTFDTAHSPELAAQVLAVACRLRSVCEPADVPVPVGFAHGYDAMRLLALGLELHASGAYPSVREALEHLPPYDGLVRRYAPAFTPTRHEALDAADFMLVSFDAQGRAHPGPVPAR